MTPVEFETWLGESSRRKLVMGVLNVTPDSFSDGGKYAGTGAAIARGVELAAEGADLIDVGGESTKPGSAPVSAEEQIARVVPVIRGVRAQCDAAISIDTGLSAVAEAAFDSGATVINDIYAGTLDPRILQTAAHLGTALVLMHMQGRPATMQENPQYADVIGDVLAFLSQRTDA